jgi:hypothetical protein
MIGEHRLRGPTFWDVVLICLTLPLWLIVAGVEAYCKVMRIER